MTKKLLDAGPSEAGWHRLQTVLKCPRLYALPTDWNKPALVKGSLIHIGLAHHYKRLQLEQRGQDPDEFYLPTEAVGALALKEYTATGSELWMEWAESAQEVVARYISFWRAEQWKIVGVEKELRAMVLDPSTGKKFLYTQRADLIVQDRGGLVHIFDHKSTARIGKRPESKYELSGQMLGYKVFGRELFGQKFAGVTLNMIQFPNRPEDGIQFSRHNQPETPLAIKTFKPTLIHAENIINTYKGRPPMEWPAAYHETACRTQYGACPNVSICKWGE